MSEQILEHSLNEIYIFDAQSLKFLLVSEGARKNLGFSMEELQGFTPPYIQPEHTYEGFRALIEPLKTGEVNGVKLTTVHKRKDGSLYPIEVYLQLSTFGSVPAFVAIVIDITMRKRAEEALCKSEERYRLLVDNIDMGITLIDKDYNVMMANRYQGEMFNKASSGLIGANCFKEFEKREEVCSHCPGTIAMESGRPEEVDTEGVLDDGSKVSVHIKAFPIFDSDSRPAGFIEVVENITERRRKEAEVLKAQKLESVGLIAGGIAHNFSNIITGILGNISLAKVYSSPEDEVFERLVEAENAVEHANRLVQQLLTFSKGGEPIKEPAYARNLIKDAVSFSLSGSNIRCEYSICEDLWPVDMDTGQINHVLSNLVMNARHAMPKGGVLSVGAENITIGVNDNEAIDGSLKNGDYIKISIEDNGTGIGTEYLDKIFDPCFSTKEEGSGLGLATSYSIIKKHDGHITAESRPGAGTTFHIYLPASKELPRDRSSEEGITGLKGKKHRGMKVLVMDDEEIIRDVTGEMLTSLGYEMDFATDGNEAIELYRKAKESGKPFDVTIMDLTIPGGMGGKEAIKKLLEIDPGAKAIVSSGYSNDPIMADFRKYGFCAVIAKPYMVAELSEKLHKVIAAG